MILLLVQGFNNCANPAVLLCYKLKLTVIPTCFLVIFFIPVVPAATFQAANFTKMHISKIEIIKQDVSKYGILVFLVQFNIIKIISNKHFPNFLSLFSCVPKCQLWFCMRSETQNVMLSVNSICVTCNLCTAQDKQTM